MSCVAVWASVLCCLYPGVEARGQAPVIIEHPRNHFSLDCRPVTFSVVASGNNLEYQWFRDNQAINSATGTSYTLAHATYPVDNRAVFYVIVANSAGTVTSSNAVLTVSQDPISVWVNCAAASNDALTIFVEFSTVVTNANDSENYTIFPSGGGPPLRVESARYATGGSLGSNVVLRLDVATPMASGTAYRLRVNGVFDECGNYINSDATWEIVEPLRLEIASSVAGTTLTWSGEAALQVTANLSGGVWQAVANARSPYGPLSLDGQRFFRLRACR